MTNTQPQSMIYYEEGAGFAHVQKLGSGSNARADLVRSLHDDKLYVRKQHTGAFPVGHNEIRDPSKEARNASRFRNTTIVTNLQGWVIYADAIRDEQKGQIQTFEVTYWDYYNSGTLGTLFDDAQARGITLPEKWICSWLLTMITTLVHCHQKGLSHKDSHSENWLLHRANQNEEPTIVLGDLDASVWRDPASTARLGKKGFPDQQQEFNEDFVESFKLLLTLQEHSNRPKSGPLYDLLICLRAHALRASSSGATIDRDMLAFTKRAKTVLRALPRATKEQLSLSQARIPAYKSAKNFSGQILKWSVVDFPESVTRFMPYNYEIGYDLVAQRGWGGIFKKENRVI